MEMMGQVRMSNVEIRQVGNRTDIFFDAQMDRNATARSYKLIVTPVAYNEAQQMALPPIVVETRRTRIMDLRHGVQPLPGALLTENGRTVRYATSVDNQEWLAGASIRLSLNSVGCCSPNCSSQAAASQSLALLSNAGQFITSAPIPAPAPVPVPAPIPAVVPAPAPIPAPAPTPTVRTGGIVLVLKKDAEYAASGPSAPAAVFHRSNVRFQQGISRVNPFIFDNHWELRNLVQALREAGSGALTGKIEITGFASPEGTQAGNYRLAHDRAIAVRNYILDNVPHLRPSDFEIINGWENWEELYTLVERSNMPDRRQVLDIIERVPAEIDYLRNTSRKQVLMNLNGGRTWRYMYANFFPQLRNATTVTYRTAAGGNVAASTSPTAMQRNTELINRAIDLIGQRDTSAALAILAQVENDSRAWNPIGACYVLESNFTKAREYFQRAIDAGHSEARANLDQLQQ